VAALVAGKSLDAAMPARDRSPKVPVWEESVNDGRETALSPGAPRNFSRRRLGRAA